MNGWNTRIRVLLILLIAVSLAALALILYMRYITDFPAGQAALTIRTGSARLTIVGSANHPGSIAELAPGDAKVLVGAGTTIETTGSALLTLTDGFTTELFAGTRLQIVQFGKQGGDVQAVLHLLAGQVVSRSGAPTEQRAFYRLDLSPNLSVEAANTEYVAAVNERRTMVGALAGTPSLRAKTGVQPIPTGSGLIVENGRTPDAPQVWSSVHIPTYRPDGTALSLPLVLDAQETNDRFTFMSDRVFLVPGGTYTLSLKLAQPYSLPSLALTPGKLTELPITMSEIVLSVVDNAGKPAPATTLFIAESAQTIVPDTPLLVGPGTVALNIARTEAPDLTQWTGKIDIQPGQRLPILLRNDLFGGGSLQVTVRGLDGTPQSAALSVYAEGSDENAPPLATFKSDDPPMPLGQGKYNVVVTLRNSISARYPVQIKMAQMTALKVELGTLTVNFVDAAARPISSRLVYIAAEQEMTRLNLTVDKMRKTVYGYALNTGQSITVPTGNYVVRVDDPRATQQTVSVTAGQNPPMTIKAAP